MVKSRFEEALAARMGKNVLVMVRTDGKLRAVLARDLFSDAAGNKLIVWFVESAPLAELELKGQGAEELGRSRRHWFVHLLDGQGRSKLRLPSAAPACTARNPNIVAKLVATAGNR